MSLLGSYQIFKGSTAVDTLRSLRKHMTIPLVHKAAVRNSCQWSFFPMPSPAQTFLRAVVTSLAGQWELHVPTRFTRSSATPPGGCSCSLSASPPPTETSAHRKENMPTVSPATIMKPHVSFFCVLEATKKPRGIVTLVRLCTRLSHQCWYEDNCTSKHFKKLFPSILVNPNSEFQKLH